MDRCISLTGLAGFLVVIGCTSSFAAETQPGNADTAKDAVPQTVGRQNGRTIEAAHDAQSMARQMAEKARDTAKRADALAASVRKAGACEPASSRTGLVSICSSDGARYYGEMKDGRFDGLGVYVSANGDMVKGEWQQGEAQGLGVTISRNGYLIQGEMRAGKAAGYGVGIGTFGRYEGQWKDGTWNGPGIETTEDATFEGEWRNGALQSH